MTGPFTARTDGLRGHAATLAAAADRVVGYAATYDARDAENADRLRAAGP